MGDAIASGTGNFTSRTSMLASLCQIRFDARLNASLILEPSGWFFATGMMPESDWNRPVPWHGRCSGSEKTAKAHRMDGVKAYAG